MLCEMNLCIYQSDGECLLLTPSIDCLGMCQDCIRVDISCGGLEVKKAAQRRELLQRIEEYGF